MAHTIRYNDDGFYTITYDPLLPWDSSIVFPRGMVITAIEMAPNAIGDSVIVRDGQAGPRIFSHEAIGTYDIAVRPYGGTRGGGKLVTPYIHAAEAVGTFDITFELAS
jgi:hypothetical protein